MSDLKGLSLSMDMTTGEMTYTFKEKAFALPWEEVWHLAQSLPQFIEGRKKWMAQNPDKVVA